MSDERPLPAPRPRAAALLGDYVQAYAEHSAREGLVREHAERGLTQIAAEHQAEAANGGIEAGE